MAKSFHGMRILARIALASMIGLACPVAGAQEAYPAHPIKLVVPFAPGGPSDAIGRFVADGLSKELNQSVIVMNKPGAGASLGAAIVAHSPADGYTLLLGHAASVSATPQLRKVSYDPIRDFEPVAAVSGNFTILESRKDFPARNMAELKALATAKPKNVSCATAGQGSGTHMACLMLGDVIGADLLIVHYKGSSLAATDLMAGRVDLLFDPSSLQHVRAGYMKALGTRGKNNTRFAELPDVQSFAEQGYPTISDEIWFGVLAPAGTPAPIIARLAAALKRATEDPQAPARLLGFSQFPQYIGPAELKPRIASEVRYYTEFVKKFGLRTE